MYFGGDYDPDKIWSYPAPEGGVARSARLKSVRTEETGQGRGVALSWVVSGSRKRPPLQRQGVAHFGFDLGPV
jgi:hypothetical protein